MRLVPSGFPGHSFANFTAVGSTCRPAESRPKPRIAEKTLFTKNLAGENAKRGKLGALEHLRNRLTKASYILSRIGSKQASSSSTCIDCEKKSAEVDARNQSDAPQMTSARTVNPSQGDSSPKLLRQAIRLCLNHVHSCATLDRSDSARMTSARSTPPSPFARW